MLRSILTSVLAFVVVSLWCRVALGQVHPPISCLPEVTSLQSFHRIGPDTILDKTHKLKSMRFDQIRDTPVLVRLIYDPNGKRALNLKFKFEDPNIISLPFNIYAVLVSVGKDKVHWIDLTESCTQPGIGFFPGQEVVLDPILLDLKTEEPMHIMVWGQH